MDTSQPQTFTAVPRTFSTRSASMDSTVPGRSLPIPPQRRPVDDMGLNPRPQPTAAPSWKSYAPAPSPAPSSTILNLIPTATDPIVVSSFQRRPGSFDTDVVITSQPQSSGQSQAQQQVQSPAPSTGGGFAKVGAICILTMVLTLGIVACTVAFTVILSSKSNDYSSRMIVNTGRRTRDWNTLNSYSMNSADEDPYTRLYVCMKTAGVVLVEGTDNPETIALYREIANRKVNCGDQSDRGWPRDYGFLRCMQKEFKADFHQSNVFLKCLDLTEGVMVENIQTDSSTVFLGSYNYVTMLLMAMGVMAAFMLFTAGGWFSEHSFRASMVEEAEYDYNGADIVDNDGKKKMRWVQSGYTYVASGAEWVPLAALPNFLALLWSFTLFFACWFYTFPLDGKWSDAVSVDEGASTLPGTPWTGYTCTGVSVMLVVYFAACLAEWYGDHGSRGYYVKRRDEEKKAALDRGRIKKLQEFSAQDPILSANDAKQFSTVSGDSYDRFKASSMPPAFFSSTYKSYSKIPSLGTRYNTQLYYAKSDDMSLQVTPLLNKVFALSLVFTDGLLFVGMLNSQNSLLNENVVAIWYYIILCRGFQFAATYFMDGVLFFSPFISEFNPNLRPVTMGAPFYLAVFGNNGNNEKFKRVLENNGIELKPNENYGSDDMGFGGKIFNDQNWNDKDPNWNNNDFNKSVSREKYMKEVSDYTHSGIAVVFSHLSSLWCMIIVLFHFVNASSVPLKISELGISTGVHQIQIAFVAFIAAMDFIKHIIAFLTVWGQINQWTYKWCIVSTYTADWLIRAVFIICMLFPITTYLGDVFIDLHAYLVS